VQVLNQGITAPLGFLAQGVAAAIKKPDREDLAVILAARECKAEAVFTTNRVQAACVKYSKEVAARGAARAVVVNSGNANACTGLQGEVDARVMAQTAAEVLHIDAEEVIVASTGVIGVPMPMERVQAGIKEACRGLSVGGGHSAARAIMTTGKSYRQSSHVVQPGYDVLVYFAHQNHFHYFHGLFISDAQAIDKTG
jgi:glutamate N-acetyltransferase/amino-acid N-acetyltransferase